MTRRFDIEVNPPSGPGPRCPYCGMTWLLRHICPGVLNLSKNNQQILDLNSFTIDPYSPAVIRVKKNLEGIGHTFTFYASVRSANKRTKLENLFRDEAEQADALLWPLLDTYTDAIIKHHGSWKTEGEIWDNRKINK